MPFNRPCMYLGNPISMQIEDREPVTPLEALDPPNPILSQHEDPQIDEGVDVGDEVEAIVVEVQKDESVRRLEVLHALYQIVLETQQPEARLGLEDGDSWKRKRERQTCMTVGEMNCHIELYVAPFLFIQLCLTR